MIRIDITRKQMISNIIGAFTPLILDECSLAEGDPKRIIEDMTSILMVLSVRNNAEAIRKLFIEGYTTILLNKDDFSRIETTAQDNVYALINLYEDSIEDSQLFGVVVNRDICW